MIFEATKHGTNIRATGTGDSYFWADFVSSNIYYPGEGDWILRRIKRVRFGTWKDYGAGCNGYLLNFDKENAWLEDFHGPVGEDGAFPKLAIIPIVLLENAIHAWEQTLKDAVDKPDGATWQVEFE